MPTFNITVFLLSYLQANVRMCYYNASFENYFQMRYHKIAYKHCPEDGLTKN